MYGRKTRGLPGTLAPMYQEFARGYKRDVGAVLDVLHPAGLGQRGRLDPVSNSPPAGRCRHSATQSTCCSIDTTMFDSTDGLPGPVIMKKFGNPVVMRPR